MSRLIVMMLAGLALAACDAPDAADFPKHALHDKVVTGSRIADTAKLLDESTTTDQHTIERTVRGEGGL